MASKWLQFPDVTLTNGSKVVSVNDSADTSGVLAGYALLVGNEFLEIESKSNNSISLVETYANATQTNVYAQVMQTHASLEESLLTALQRLNTNADTFDQVKGAALKEVATTEEAKVGTADVLPDAAGVLATIQQFGVGTPIFLNAGDDLNDYDDPSFLITSGAAINNPTSNGVYVFVNGIGANSAVQIACDAVTSLAYIRFKLDGVWDVGWDPIYTGANYQPEVSNGNGIVKRMINNSGASVTNNAILAGSSLLFYQSDVAGNSINAGSASGSWKNVSGLTIASGNRGEFVRVS